VQWAGSEKIRIGLIGCGQPDGSRGLDACRNALAADPAVEISAMGDLFQDNLEYALRLDNGRGDLPRGDGCAVKVPPEMRFVGWTPTKKSSNRNSTTSSSPRRLTSAPYTSRPPSRRARTSSPRNPLPWTSGRQVLHRNRQTRRAEETHGGRGTQRRHQKHYLDIMKRIKDGEIGEVVAAQVYWTTPNMTPLRPNVGGSEWKTRSGTGSITTGFAATSLPSSTSTAST